VLREVRLGLALNGGVSLAIWIGGVVDEFLRAVSAGSGHPDAQQEWVDLCRELDVQVQIDVVVGTSAGGVNGAFLAAGLANDAANLVALQNLWIDSGDFSQLLYPPRSVGVRSLLRGDSYFLPNLKSALETVAASGRGERVLDPPLDIRLTSTDLRGKVQSISDGASVLQSVDHTVEFRFTDRDFHFAAEPKASTRVARACRSTASFPGAFEASPVPTGLFDARHAPALAVDGTVEATFLVDGGVLNNLPARNAVEAIEAQPAGEQVHRVLALVVPDPVVRASQEGAEPLMAQTIGQAAVTIPRNQSLSAFLVEVRDHNNDVLSRRSARAAFLGELGELEPAPAWDRFVAVSDALFPSYRAARHRRSCDRILARLADKLDPDLARVLVDVAGDAESVTLPWVPEALDERQGDYWGGSPVRRLVALMLSWTNLAGTVLHEAGADAEAARLLGRKHHLTAIRAEADRYAPIGAIDELLLEEMARPGAAPAEALATALRRWSVDADAPELSGLVGRLGGHLGHLVDVVRPYVSAAPTDAARTMSGLVTLYDGAGAAGAGRLLLGFEVVEMAFGPADPPPDQFIRLAHFTADEPVAMDPAHRDDPEDKLAGVQLGHFAAFLKRSWRANDWMWGRLDAAERLVRLLDEACGHPLAASGRLDHHIRALQAAVLRDLLPVVAVEIEVDGLAGAAVTDEARRFADATRAAARPGAGAGDVVNLDDVDLAGLEELLALNRVGAERLAAEVGMPRASNLMLNAVTTMSALLNDEAPRGTRAVTEAVSSLSAVAWRWHQVPASRRRMVVVAAAAFTVLALGVIVAGALGSSRSGLTVLAWIVLVVGALLAAGRYALFSLRRRACFFNDTATPERTPAA